MLAVTLRSTGRTQGRCSDRNQHWQYSWKVQWSCSTLAVHMDDAVTVLTIGSLLDVAQLGGRPVRGEPDGVQTRVTQLGRHVTKWRRPRLVTPLRHLHPVCDGTWETGWVHEGTNHRAEELIKNNILIVNQIVTLLKRKICLHRREY